MKIVIAGGSGFLGSPLAEMYAEDGHDVRVLTRSLPSGETRHDPGTGVPGITRVGLERRRRQRTMGDRRRSRRRGHQSLGRVAGCETLVGRGEEAVAGEPTPRDAEPRDGDRRRRVAAGGSGERQRRWILRTGRFHERSPETDPAGSDFLAELCVELGTRGPPGRAPGHTRRSAQDRRRPRTIGRRVAGNDATVQVLRWRADRIRTSIRVVDPSPRLDRDRAVDRPDAERQWTGERDRAPPRDQPPPLDRARSRDASAQPAARARLRREDRRSASSPPRC